MTPLSPCPHRELIPGPLAAPADVAAWAATLAAEGCEQCAAPVAPPAEALPADVAAALRQEGRAGAVAAQATLDALGVGEALLGAVAARLAEQPGTCVGWRRWWAGWRSGALVGASHAPTS